MTNIFRPKALGGEFKLHPLVEICYKDHIPNMRLEKEEIGKCNAIEKEMFGGLMNRLLIEICVPNFNTLQELANIRKQDSTNLYYLILGHEEAHALQFSGNFSGLISLAEKILSKNFNKELPLYWDSLWKPNVDSIKYIQNLFEQDFLEQSAKIGEFIALTRQGYSKKGIELLFGKE